MAEVIYMLGFRAGPDRALEAEITAVTLRIKSADDARIKRIYARAQADLIALRSASQVAAMEQAKGLG